MVPRRIIATSQHYLRAAGRPGRPGQPPSEQSTVGRDIRTYGSVWSAPAEFARFVAEVRAQELPKTPRPPTFVPTTTLWWVDGTGYLSRLAIRHRLAPGRISERNGHIGYDVRPSARRRGTPPRCWRRRSRSP